MDKRIFIFEDDDFDWGYIKHMLNQKKIEYYPKLQKDFDKIKIYINLITHPMEFLTSKNKLLELINENDFVLLDFEVIETNRFFDGIKLYKELGLKNKAIVYSKYKDHPDHYNKIVESIKTNTVLSEDLIFKKPGNFIKSHKKQQYIDELYNAIVFGNNFQIQDSSPPFNSKL
jgi:hypothetical protein